MERTTHCYRSGTKVWATVTDDLQACFERLGAPLKYMAPQAEHAEAAYGLTLCRGGSPPDDVAALADAVTGRR